MSETPLPREQFPVCEQYVYVNHAGFGALPRCAADAGKAFLDDLVARGMVGFEEWDARMNDVRPKAGQLMGVPPNDLAFVKNTTEGLGFVAHGLEWHVGDRVIVPDREFPSTIYPWLSLQELGVTVDRIEPVGEGWALPIEEFERALKAAPARLVAVSWVQFSRGYRLDLGELAALCHAHGALLCVDVIQGLGVIPAELERWGVDFAMADAHKWMLGPLGTGVFYVAERCRDLLRPLEPGWASVVHREDWDNLNLIYDDSARRFEGGTQTIETILQMGASIDLVLETGVDAIWTHVNRLLDHLVGGLVQASATVVSDRSAPGRSAHITFTVDGHDPERVFEQLDAKHIACSARGGGVRIAPHGYNTFDEMDTIVEAVQAIAHS